MLKYIILLIKKLVGNFEIISIDKDEHYWNNEGNKQFSSYWKVIVKNILL
ncbi:MAG: hypothetical protein ACOC4G_09900 [Bacillota bacterium]